MTPCSAVTTSQPFSAFKTASELPEAYSSPFRLKVPPTMLDSSVRHGMVRSRLAPSTTGTRIDVQLRPLDTDPTDDIHAAEARQVDQHRGACAAELGRRPQRGDAEAAERELLRAQPHAPLHRGRPILAGAVGRDAVGRPGDLVPIQGLGRHVQVEERFPAGERERAPQLHVVVAGAHARGVHAHHGAGPRVGRLGLGGVQAGGRDAERFIQEGRVDGEVAELGLGSRRPARTRRRRRAQREFGQAQGAAHARDIPPQVLGRRQSGDGRVHGPAVDLGPRPPGRRSRRPPRSRARTRAPRSGRRRRRRRRPPGAARRASPSRTAARAGRRGAPRTRRRSRSPRSRRSPAGPRPGCGARRGSPAARPSPPAAAAARSGPAVPGPRSAGPAGRPRPTARRARPEGATRGGPDQSRSTFSPATAERPQVGERSLRRRRCPCHAKVPDGTCTGDGSGSAVTTTEERPPAAVTFQASGASSGPSTRQSVICQVPASPRRPASGRTASNQA